MPVGVDTAAATRTTTAPTTLREPWRQARRRERGSEGSQRVARWDEIGSGRLRAEWPSGPVTIRAMDEANVVHRGVSRGTMRRRALPSDPALRWSGLGKGEGSGGPGSGSVNEPGAASTGSSAGEWGQPDRRREDRVVGSTLTADQPAGVDHLAVLDHATARNHVAAWVTRPQCAAEGIRCDGSGVDVAERTQIGRRWQQHPR